MRTNSTSAGLAVHARTIATTRHLTFRRAWLWTSFLAFATIAFGPRPAQAVVTEAWVQRYGSEAGSEDSADKVVTDAAGNVIVAGSTGNQTGSVSDTLIIKYSGAGVALWTNRYNESANSYGSSSAVAVDASGNVVVTGRSCCYDYYTAKYAAADGALLWEKRYNGPANREDQATAVAVDGSGNVLVTGSSSSGVAGNFTYYDYYTAKYAAANGTLLWENRYNGPGNSFDIARAVAVDGSGNVFVTGSSGLSPSGGDWDYATIAYSGAGVPLWTNRYNRSWNDQATAVAVDASGNVFVTGSSATIAYSGAGVPLWTNGGSGTAIALDGSGNVFVTGFFATIAYSGAGVALWTNGGSGTAIALDGSGNVFVTGSSYGSGGDSDYAMIAYSGAGVPLWTNRYNGPANSDDVTTGVAVDASGNVFVTGYSYGSGGDSDYATIAYSGAGVPLWTSRYGGRRDTSIANAVAVDCSGNVFVTGYSGYFDFGLFNDYATIAYSGAGVPLWTNRYNGPANGDDEARAVAVDASSGNVFVTGYSYGILGNKDYATIAYSGAGVPLWTNRYDGSWNDQATAVVVDASGNVFVTGSSEYPFGFASIGSAYATIAYSGAGVPLWTNRYDGSWNDQANAVAVNASGNVFVTGSGGSDYATIAYSGEGVPLWTNRYNGGNGYDQATAVAVDASGNVFVTGYSYGILGNKDYATIAYSGEGVPLRTNRYDGTANGDDQATAVAVDGGGNVFVTGSSVRSEGGYDYATIAYSSAGVPLWTNRYNGPANGDDQATAVAVDASGNVFVTGSSFGSGGDWDYATIVYSGAGVPLCTNHYNVANQSQTKSSLAIGSDGAVYVTGTSTGLFVSDFVTVKYIWRTEIAIQLLSTMPPKVNLTLSGAPNSSWAIERALELTGPWTNLSALLIGTNGSAQFQDTHSPYPAGFYRARQQ